jgi:hypothetical protein
VRLESGQHVFAPHLQGPPQSGDLWHWALVKGIDDLLGDQLTLGGSRDAVALGVVRAEVEAWTSRIDR